MIAKNYLEAIVFHSCVILQLLRVKEALDLRVQIWFRGFRFENGLLRIMIPIVIIFNDCDNCGNFGFRSFLEGSLVLIPGVHGVLFVFLLFSFCLFGKTRLCVANFPYFLLRTRDLLTLECRSVSFLVVSGVWVRVCMQGKRGRNDQMQRRKHHTQEKVGSDRPLYKTQKSDMIVLKVIAIKFD